MIINKPIVIFDIETTGLDIINDQIIDISLIKIDLDSSEKLKQYKIKPAIKISKESTEIHGISDKDVENCKPFQFYSKDIFDFIKGCDLGGFNILKFDLPILIEEFMRCNIELKLENIKIIDALRLYHLMEKRNLSSAYKFYCNKILENAHDSYADTKATVEIIKKLVKDGYDQTDIAILVRKKEQATEIGNELIKEGFNISSSESMLVNHSIKVQLIIAIY